VNASFEFNETGVLTRLAGITERAQFELDQAVLADSNYYCPQDKGDLQKSGIIASGGGEVTWNTPYARYQYYDAPNKSHDQNPYAMQKWFEEAKAQNLDRWLSKVQGEFN
jgi:hypothetical protein